MDWQIHRTQNGIKKYPLHQHNHYEIMLYLEGTGQLCTTKNAYPFVPGTIVIVPPGTLHGSSSENGFQNISVSGEFEQLLSFQKPVTLTDNPQKEGEVLARLIYQNRYGNHEYLAKLCSAYVHFILQNLKIEDSIGLAVNQIISEITNHFFDCNINLNRYLKQSGYAEDYVRSQFKRLTGKTPNEFLTDIRIRHTCFLIDIYANSLSLQQIAERCGYVDYVYFSKKFKSVTGISPKEYKNRLTGTKES